jgi:lipopolysaccharide/colanic/teichoic acid biosynthesis glycosyltransferase
MNAQFQIRELKRELTTISSGDGFISQFSYENFNSAKAKSPARALRGDTHSDLGFDWTAKRLYDVFFSFCGLVLLAPMLAIIAALVKMADGGDIFYRQTRVGRGGREFRIYKFRTMMAAAEKSGPSVTKHGDARVTWIGRILRKTKLDELPQLWNVLKGDMSLVGPRPEVPRYVQQYTPEQRAILQQKPGITDLASLCFRDEEALLANADNVEEFYVRYCIPRKIRLNQEYTGRANLLSDTWIILQTVCPYWVGVLACYGIILAATFWFSYELICNFAPLRSAAPHFGRELCVALGLQLACLMWHRQCRGLLSYFSYPEVRQVGAALGLAAAGLLAWSFADGGEPPPNVILINALLSFCMLGGFRVLLRQWRERSEQTEGVSSDLPARVGIIGAGSTGARLALELRDSRNSGRMAVAFFDDDFHKWQKSIHDVPVAGMPECLLDGWTEKLDEVVIAMPDAPENRVREIEQLLRKTSLKFYIVAGPARFWDCRQAA